MDRNEKFQRTAETIVGVIQKSSQIKEDLVPAAILAVYEYFVHSPLLYPTENVDEVSAAYRVAKKMLNVDEVVYRMADVDFTIRVITEGQPEGCSYVEIHDSGGSVVHGQGQQSDFTYWFAEGVKRGIELAGKTCKYENESK